MQYTKPHPYALIISVPLLWFANSKCKPYCLQIHSQSIFHQSPKNWQKYNTFRSCVQYKFSDICLWSSPTTWGCCRGWRPKCICRWDWTWQRRLVGCRRLSEFLNIGLRPCPKCGRGRRNWRRRWGCHRGWNERRSRGHCVRVGFWDIFRYVHPKCEHSRRTSHWQPD